MSLILVHRGRAYTRNAEPGTKVYGERLIHQRGKEWREWSARRSKLAAYFANRGRAFRMDAGLQWLYLGAASGTTVSHVADATPDGRIVAVEFSVRPFRDLLRLAGRRNNIVPVLSDAGNPESYALFVDGTADVVYQDIAQRDQDRLFVNNAQRFLSNEGTGLLAVKARSVNVAAAPDDVYARVGQRVEEAGFKVLETVRLDPWQKDHAMLVVRH